MDSEHGPYIVLVLQECNRMNVLLSEVKHSLLELIKGLNGQLIKTTAMEDLHRALSNNEVKYHPCPHDRSF